ncbi:hypothetical protein SLS61_008656 [Didymella pomorum]
MTYLSFKMEWNSEWRKDLGPAPLTELGFAVIHGEDIKLVNRPDISLEDLLADIRAFHEQVKTMVADMFSEGTYHTDGERRPLILIDQGFYDDIKLIKKNYGIDTDKTDVFEIIQARYVALDAGTLGPTDLKGLKRLTRAFGLGTAESWYLHNAGNDAIVTLCRPSYRTQ